MAEAYKTTIYEAVQGHKALLEAWNWAKPMVIAGHRLNVVIKPETRSTEQNSKMWAMLSEISTQVDWYGQKLSAEDWKHVLSASLKKQRAVQGLDGGFVVLGLSTSKMTKGEMADLITLMEAFGAQRGVKFSDDATDRDMRLAA
ncbi:recombination protein NinB [Polynucleobacter sp.]|uniref:recombination protein NinB n=1 Tax=Polynucleobacter sp. TaxID=2029855 RepID=UPI003F6A28DF